MTNLSAVNLNRLVVFAAVVEAGSLTAAADRLGIAKTMVSTHMQRLEAEVGASLLVRAQCRFEWNLTSSTIMASAVSHQILREPMFDVEPMH
jgi:molybdenum-dependent DNA-binding transcriptional regulator ModE